MESSLSVEDGSVFKRRVGQCYSLNLGADLHPQMPPFTLGKLEEVLQNSVRRGVGWRDTPIVA
jgi:hypothetical protein